MSRGTKSQKGAPTVAGELDQMHQGFEEDDKELNALFFDLCADENDFPLRDEPAHRNDPGSCYDDDYDFPGIEVLPRETESPTNEVPEVRESLSGGGAPPSTPYSRWRALRLVLFVFVLDCWIICSIFFNNMAALLGIEGYTRQPYRWPD